MSIFSTHLEQIDSRFAVAFESIVIMPVHSCMCQSFSVQKTDDQVMDVVSMSSTVPVRDIETTIFDPASVFLSTHR
jgi:hypothetical protein